MARVPDALRAVGIAVVDAAGQGWRVEPVAAGGDHGGAVPAPASLVEGWIPAVTGRWAWVDASVVCVPHGAGRARICVSLEKHANSSAPSQPSARRRTSYSHLIRFASQWCATWLWTAWSPCPPTTRRSGRRCCARGGIHTCRASPPQGWSRPSGTGPCGCRKPRAGAYPHHEPGAHRFGQTLGPRGWHALGRKTRTHQRDRPPLLRDKRHSADGRIHHAFRCNNDDDCLSRPLPAHIL